MLRRSKEQQRCSGIFASERKRTRGVSTSSCCWALTACYLQTIFHNNIWNNRSSSVISSGSTSLPLALPPIAAAATATAAAAAAHDSAAVLATTRHRRITMVAAIFDRSPRSRAGSRSSRGGRELRSSCPRRPWPERGNDVSPRWRLLDGENVHEYVATRSSHRAHQHDQEKDDGGDRSRDLLTERGRAQDWLSASADLALSLGIDPEIASEAEHRRVFHLYLPVFFWVLELLADHRGGPVQQRPRPHVYDASDGCRKHPGTLVVGVSAPQGCGKTTLVEEMRRMLEGRGHSCAVISIDDFYLRGAEQDALAARSPSNPLLQVRGNAGTHDLALGLSTIRALKHGTGESEHGPECATTVRVPRYDKSARGGRGDRAPEDEWDVVSAPPDIILLEGWMLGFEPLPDESPLLVGEGEDARDLGSGVTGLCEVNQLLAKYGELHAEVDAWLVLKTSDPKMVFEWRAQAERQMRESGRPAMSEREVRDFCNRYMPAYRAYLPGLYERASAWNAGQGADDTDRVERQQEKGSWSRAMLIEVGTDRNPVSR